MITIRLTVERLRAGGLRMWSADAPGMVVNEADARVALDKLGPALGVAMPHLIERRER